MPRNTIYRSKGWTNSAGIRFYWDIIPADTQDLDSPPVVKFPAGALAPDSKIREELGGDIIGNPKPRTCNVRVDLMMLPEDLREYLLNPFVEASASEWAPPEIRGRRNDVSSIRLPNLWILKSDLGNPGVYYHLFIGVQELTPDADLKTSAAGDQAILDVTLVDWARYCMEQVETEYIANYFEWDLKTEPEDSNKKVAERVYDLVVVDDELGSSGLYETVKVMTTNVAPSGSVIQGVSISEGDRALQAHATRTPKDIRIAIWEWDGSAWLKVKNFGGLINDPDNSSSDIRYNDKVFVTSGDYGGKLVEIQMSYWWAQSVFWPTIEIRDLTSGERIAAKYNYAPGFEAIFYPTYDIIRFGERIANQIAEKINRNSGLIAGNNGFLISGGGTLWYPFARNQFYEQDYSNSTGKGGSLTFEDGPMFLAYVRQQVSGAIGGGFVSGIEGEPSITEHPNYWDLIGILAGSTGTIVRLSLLGGNGFSYLSTTSPLEGSTLAKFPVGSQIILDTSTVEGESRTIRLNADLARAATINIDVEAPNPNEYTDKQPGTLAKRDISIKAVFHNCPTTDSVHDKSINEVGHTDAAEIDHGQFSDFGIVAQEGFDARKLAYFATPSWASSEVACRPASAVDITFAVSQGIPPYYEANPIYSTYSFPNSFRLFAQRAFKGAGSPNVVARYLRDLFGKPGNAEIDLSIRAGTIPENTFPFPSSFPGVAFAGLTVDVDIPGLMPILSGSTTGTEGIITKCVLDLEKWTRDLTVWVAGVDA